MQSISNNKKKNYLENKEYSRTVITERVTFFAGLYGVKVGKIAIRNQKSRWGSCSMKRNLNFNYKVAYLPKELRDFVIVHEICHLIEFNHSKKFWSHVAKIFPEYNKLAKILRKTDIRAI